MKFLLIIMLLSALSFSEDFHIHTNDTLKVESLDFTDNGSHVKVVYSVVKKHAFYKDTYYIKDEYSREPDICQDYGLYNYIRYTWALYRTTGSMVLDTVEKHIKWR